MRRQIFALIASALTVSGTSIFTSSEPSMPGGSSIASARSVITDSVITEDVTVGGAAGGGAAANSCVTCHAGIEEIHPGYRLTCVDCHGGDPNQETKDKAHVLPKRKVHGDERVLPANYDLPYQRFLNPSNLRVAEEICGDCHEHAISDTIKSLHGTTAGHLGDGFYDKGLVDSKIPTYSIFPVKDTDGEIPEHAISETQQVPPFKRSGARDRIETQYSDLPRKACMHCHLYSEGRAVDGRLDLDGDYRGEGCAACHVTYADDGKSQSRDRSIDKREPGHPLKHRFTSKIPTDTCTRCHYGDASIGLQYRGLAMLVPGMPAGPGIKGTTDTLKNGMFYIKDPLMTPPDAHHAAGMHCIDCHTISDTMGDGNIYPQMDHAVEIECSDCHGTLEKVTELITSRGRRITNLDRDDEDFYLTSKITGKKHLVLQIKNIVDPQHHDYNPQAAEAMNEDHGRLECYTCHSGWNVNSYGLHFDRNEQFTQLDLISGESTPGRVAPQQKVFATFNQLRLGFNHEGMIAPYLAAYSTIGSARDKKGEIILHQGTPETHAGLSGVTQVPQQMHTTQRTARTCVECHRSPATYGLGTTNFRLTREFAYGITAARFYSIAVDSKTPRRSSACASLELRHAPLSIGLRTDPVHARATHAYLGCEDGTLTIVDLKNPVMPKIVGSMKDLLHQPKDILAEGDYLFVADGYAGVSIFDLTKPKKPKRIASIPSTDASSLSLAWPWLLVADGAGGLVIMDVSDPAKAHHLSTVDLNGGEASPNEALDVDVLFQYSRLIPSPDPDRLERSDARHIAVVASGLDGVRIIDFTDASHPVILHGGAARKAFSFGRGDIRGVAINTVFDIGSAGRGIPSGEHDYLYVYYSDGGDDSRENYVRVYDITDARKPRRMSRSTPRVLGTGTGRLHLVRTFNAPSLQHNVLVEGAGGIGTLINVSKASTTGVQAGSPWTGVSGLRAMAFEEFAFDRLQDERARPIKDISHDNCRYLDKNEILKVLGTPIPLPKYRADKYGFAIDDKR